MAIVIDKPGLGELLGSGFGSGLSQGVQALTNQKLQQIQQQNQRMQLASGLQSILGVSPQESQAYASLPESSLAQLLKQNVRMQQLNQILGGGVANENQPKIQEALQGISEQRTRSFSPEQLTQATVIDPALGNALRAQQAQEETARHNKQVEEAGLQRLKQGERRLENEEEARNYDFNKEYISGIKQRARSAPEIIKDNEQIIKIIDEGKWGSPKVRSLLSKGGLEFLVNNPTSEAAKSLANKQFIDTLKSLGAKNTSDFESRQLLSTYPNLLQTEEGAKFIAKNMILKAKADQREKQIGDEILRENKNRIPRDFEARVQERMEPYRAQLREEFDNNLASVLKSQENKPGNFKLGKTFDNLPKNPATGARFIDDKGNVVRWNGTRYEKV